MNYLKHYVALMRKAEKRTPPKGYTEHHHIFPRSVYGANPRVVALTAREHFIAHALLVRIFLKRYGLNSGRTHKMIYALTLMKGKGTRLEAYCNSYIYEGNKKRSSIVKIGAKPRWYNNGEKSIFREIHPGEGWKPGRMGGWKNKERGNKKGNSNAKQYTWRLLFDDGSDMIVKNLCKYAKENDLSHNHLKNVVRRGKPYKNIMEIIKV